MEDTDLLLVERAGTSYKIETQDMSNLQDSDLLLVEREGVSYKMTADQLPSGGGATGFIEQPVQVLTPLNGAGLNDGEPYKPLSTAITAVGADGDLVYTTDTIASVAEVSNVDQSLVWSDYVTGSPYSASFNPVNGFDGTADRMGGGLTFTPPNPIACTKVRLYMTTYSAPADTIFLNGVDIASGIPITGEFNIPVEFTPSGNQFVSYQMGPAGNGEPGWLSKIELKINGLWVALIDQGVSISSVVNGNVLTFPTSNNFDKFEVGDVVQDSIPVTLDPDTLLTNSTLSNGNLTGLAGSGATGGIYATTSVFTGKWYWELTVGAAAGGMIGIGDLAYPNNTWAGGGEGGYFWYYNGDKYTSGNIASSYSTTYTTGDVIGVALDCDAGTLNYYKNGVDQGVAFTGLQGRTFRPFFQDGSGSGFGFTANFGESAWYSSIPSGYSPLADGVKIIAIDPAGPSITVDGGSWYGTNDGRYEPSQEWSDGADKSHSSYPVSNGFDGNETTIAYSEAGDPILITFNPAVSISSSLDIWANYVGSNNDHLIINGTSVANSLSSGNSIVKNTFTQFTELSTLQIGSNGAGSEYVGFSKIAIDGKLLVNSSVPNNGSGGKPWNQSQGWSFFGSGTPANTEREWDNVFDGSTEVDSQAVAFPSTNGTMLWKPPIPLTVVESVICYCYCQRVASIRLNDSVEGKADSVQNYAQPMVFTASELGNTLSEIKLTNEGNYGTYLTAVEVDGILLVDPGIPGAADTDISKTISAQATLTFTDDTELANMVGPLTMVDENGDVKTPVTSEIANVSQASGWNQSETWSNNSAGDFNQQDASSDFNRYKFANAFDANLSTVALGNQGVWTWNPGFTNVTKLEIYGVGTSNTNGEFTALINDSDSKTIIGSSNYLAGNPLVFTFSSRTDITSIQLSTTGHGGYTGLLKIKINGVELVDPSIPSAPDPTYGLTFDTPNPDLEYFQVGDVVKSTLIDSPVFYLGDRPDYPFLGNDETVSTASDATGFQSFTFNGTEGIYNVCFFLTDNTDSDIQLNIAGGSQWGGYSSVDGKTWTSEGTFNPGDPFSIRSVCTNNPNARYFLIGAVHAPDQISNYMAFALNQTYLDNWSPPYPSDFESENVVKITAVDTANNTMTVDGGSWYGQDSSGDAGDGRYEPSQEWSSTGTTTGDIDRWTNVFTLPIPPDLSDNSPYPGASRLSNNANSWTFASSFDGVVELFASSSTSTGATGGRIELKNSAGDILHSVPCTEHYDSPLWKGPFSITDLKEIYLTYTDSGGQYDSCCLWKVKVNGRVLVDSSVPGGQGATKVTGQPLIASADDVEYVDGNVLGVSNVSGTWLAGLYAQGALVTSYAPSPQSIIFTSMNGGTTDFTGTDATLTSRTWTLEKGNSATGPWTDVGVYLDFAANASQDGATPWANPELEPNKFYQVKVEYNSSNAVSVISTFNTFKTGDA